MHSPCEFPSGNLLVAWMLAKRYHKQSSTRVEKMPDIDGYILALLREHTGSNEAIGAVDLAAKATAFLGKTIDGRAVRQPIAAALMVFSSRLPYRKFLVRLTKSFEARPVRCS